MLKLVARISKFFAIVLYIIILFQQNYLQICIQQNLSVKSFFPCIYVDLMNISKNRVL